MKTSQIIIRNAEHNDINILTGLLEQLFSIEKDFNFDQETQKRGLALMMDGCGKHRTVKIAIYKGKIVGMCTAQTRISTAFGAITAVLEDLVVDESCRGKGIGTALLKEMSKWAKLMGITRLSLLADQHNHSAINFYQNNGWKNTDLICLIKNSL